jgi:hypothetical protein
MHCSVSQPSEAVVMDFSNRTIKQNRSNAATHATNVILTKALARHCSGFVAFSFFGVSSLSLADCDYSLSHEYWRATSVYSDASLVVASSYWHRCYLPRHWTHYSMSFRGQLS